MTPDKWRRNEAGRWLSIAGKDLNAARALVPVEPAASVFHSQQAAEKSVKAFLVFHDIAFRRTHDLQELGSLCVGIAPTLKPLLEAAEDLTDYAVIFRYLDAPREPDEAEASEALAKARRLNDHVRELLTPPPAF